MIRKTGAQGYFFETPELLRQVRNTYHTRVDETEMGILMNIIVGIIGAYIGAFLANLLGIRLGEIFQGWFWGNLLVAVVGAVILIAVVRMFRQRSA